MGFLQPQKVSRTIPCALFSVVCLLTDSVFNQENAVFLNGLRKTIFVGLFGLGVLLSGAHAGFPMASKRLPVTVGGQTYQFPYESSHDLSAANETVEHVILSVHCSGFNAHRAYRNAEIAIQQAGGDPQKYLILAPHFLTPGMIRERISNPTTRDLLHWTSNPFWGGSNGIYNGHRAVVSSFDTMDQLLENVVSSGNFPNVKDIVVMGLSAGGQMVNRYAAANTFEFYTAAPKGIDVRYLVMAPSTYVYFTPERMTGRDGELRIPRRAPGDYNVWGYGLDSMYEYHLRHGLTAKWIKSHFPQRRILYLVGGDDTDFSDKMLAKNPSAMLQGVNRLDRGYIYMDYLTKLFGDKVGETQSFYEIPGIGHTDRPLICSPQGLAFVFSPDASRQIAQEQ